MHKHATAVAGLHPTPAALKTPPTHCRCPATLPGGAQDASRLRPWLARPAAGARCCAGAGMCGSSDIACWCGRWPAGALASAVRLARLAACTLAAITGVHGRLNINRSPQRIPRCHERPFIPATLLGALKFTLTLLRFACDLAHMSQASTASAHRCPWSGCCAKKEWLGWKYQCRIAQSRPCQIHCWLLSYWPPEAMWPLRVKQPLLEQRAFKCHPLPLAAC